MKTNPLSNQLDPLNVPGTYALIFYNHGSHQVQVGKLGCMLLIPGFYIYIGSAFGPGGLRSRLSRHTGLSTPDHWHIDYLKQVTHLVEIWITTDRERLEHTCAEAFQGLPGSNLPLLGFGSSDCRCRSHLVYLPYQPKIEDFRASLERMGYFPEEIRSWLLVTT